MLEEDTFRSTIANIHFLAPFRLLVPPFVNLFPLANEVVSAVTVLGALTFSSIGLGFGVAFDFAEPNIDLELCNTLTKTDAIEPVTTSNNQRGIKTVTL